MQSHSFNKYRLLFPTALACLCLCLWSIRACASGHPVPDLDREGTISLIMQETDSQKAVPGGTMTLYQVADVEENDGNYFYTLTEAFSGSGEKLTELDAELAERLADYAEKKDPAGITKKIDSEGKVVFEKLKPGLYLLVQKEAAKGYYRINPFVISVPMEEDGSYVYDVSAAPKMEGTEKRPGSGGGTGGGTPDTEESAPPSGESRSLFAPKTWDGADPAVWTALILLALSGAAAAIYRICTKERGNR